MFKVKLEIKGTFVIATVTNIETGEKEYKFGESLLGNTEEYGRGLAQHIIAKMKAKEAELQVIEYETE